MAATVSSEEVQMVVLGKEQPKEELNQSLDKEQSLEETLPWDQTGHKSACETLPFDPMEIVTRPSPEGSREETLGKAVVDSENFPEAPAAKEREEEEKEEEEEEEDFDKIPGRGAHTFVPIDPYCIERTPTVAEKKKRPSSQDFRREVAHCEKKGDPEKQNFIPRGRSAQFDNLPSCHEESAKSCAERLPCLQSGNCTSANLKAVASMIGATLIFPCLVYGAYVFLPFDVPSMPTMSSRLVYTLRCGVFATFPIIVGMIVYGVSRLCFSSAQPLSELRREVEIHQHYVTQSVDLFILYFFNIAVLSTYLPQEGLKLIPLLTGLFAISRLVYWLAYAMGRSFRGFGFGLTFLPLVTMLLFNLYSMFIMDPENMFAMAGGMSSPAEKEHQMASSKPRFWG